MSYEKEIRKLNKKIDDLIQITLNMDKNEKVTFTEKKKKIIFQNFLAGVFRGFGMAVGFTILVAIIIFILRKIVLLNLPIVSEYISDIIDIIQK